MKLSEGLIAKIADSINADFICYVNPETGELEEMMNNEALADYGIYWEEEEEENDSAFEPDWQKEMREDTKAQMARIDSWKHRVIIEKPDSHESFRFMEDFVEEIIPENKQEIWWKALRWKKPFANFNDLVHNSEYREKWFAFKQGKLEEYVRKELQF